MLRLKMSEHFFTWMWFDFFLQLDIPVNILPLSNSDFKRIFPLSGESTFHGHRWTSCLFCCLLCCSVASCIITRNNIVWKLARGYCLCYCKTFALVPDSTECTKVFVTKKCSTLFAPPKFK